MTQEDLKHILPHRDNMLLLDSAEIVDGKAVGRKTITGDEWFLKGHFPNNPVTPGVILCEILAQSVCVLMAARRQKKAQRGKTAEHIKRTKHGLCASQSADLLFIC